MYIVFKIQEVIIELERLRLARKDFNEASDQQERELIQRLHRSNFRGPESTTSDSIAVGAPCPDNIKSEREIHLRPNHHATTEYHSITSNSDLQPGDRVRITNSLRHISGPIAEEDRLGNVVKVNKVFILVLTDSGHSVNRIKSNLQKARGPRIVK